ncbi:hypothetical protein C266_04089 [Pandoraea sp. SD6-2]|nr:hypothetical protein C266_04089 [Pandoraea sp. SD6-2]
MKAEDTQRELIEHGSQYERHGGGDLPLGNAVHGVDVIDAILAAEVALMDTVDADKVGPVIG